MEFRFGNVNQAFYQLTNYIYSKRDKGTLIEEDSRNGKVLRFPEPVTIHYEKPRQRVLFSPHRDANPFFHLYESLWMLAGSNRVDQVAYYAKQMNEYTDEGETLNGAYGYRWRKSKTDQLNVLIEHLKANPQSRRAVLQMWNVEDDLLKIDTSKDVCCNLSVMFSLREATREETAHNEDLLDMTVTNRSNDVIWGLVGASYVDSTMLQE